MIAPDGLGRTSRHGWPVLGLLLLILTGMTIGLTVTAVMVAINPEAHSFIATLFCDGEVSRSSFDNSLRPGERSTVHVVYCTDAAGQRHDITFLVYVVGAPVFYGSIAAAVLMLVWRGWIRPRLRRIWSQGIVVSASERPAHDSAPTRPPDTARRLAEVRELYESGTITEEEHEVIRARILADI